MLHTILKPRISLKNLSYSPNNTLCVKNSCSFESRRETCEAPTRSMVRKTLLSQLSLFEGHSPKIASEDTMRNEEEPVPNSPSFRKIKVAFLSLLGLFSAIFFSILLWAHEQQDMLKAMSTKMANLEDEPIELKTLPTALAAGFKGCPYGTRARFFHSTSTYQAVCIDPTYGANGPRIKWDAITLSKVREEFYIRGKIVGEAKTWLNGKLLSIEMIGPNGLQEGETKIFDSNTGKVTIQNFHNGKMHDERHRKLSAAEELELTQIK